MILNKILETKTVLELGVGAQTREVEARNKNSLFSVKQCRLIARLSKFKVASWVGDLAQW